MLKPYDLGFCASRLPRTVVSSEHSVNINKDSKELSKCTPPLTCFENCPLLPSSLQQQPGLLPAATCSARQHPPAQKTFSQDFGCLLLQMYQVRVDAVGGGKERHARASCKAAAPVLLC